MPSARSPGRSSRSRWTTTEWTPRSPYSPPWEQARPRSRPTWGFAEGDELAPGRTVLRRIGGGRRYEAMLVWDDHRLAVLVAKVLRPDQAADPTALRRPRAARPRCSSASATRSSCAASAAVADGRFPHLVLEHLDGPTLDELLADGQRSRSSSSCRSGCTSPPPCTTWPARASCTSTSSRATSSWAARRA